MEEVAATKISGEEDRYSHTDLWDFRANFDGSRKIFELVKPLHRQRRRLSSTKVSGNFQTVDETLAKYKEGDGYETYDKLTEADRTVLAAARQHAGRGPLDAARQARAGLSRGCSPRFVSPLAGENSGARFCASETAGGATERGEGTAPSRPLSLPA